MTRRSLILLLLLMPAIAGSSAIAQKPRLVVVYKPGCPPCHIFFSVFKSNPKFRQALERAFDLRELDVSRPGDAVKAEAYNVTVVPTFIAMRGNKFVAKSEGFAWTMGQNDVRLAIDKLMLDLGIEWPRVIAPPDTSPPRVESPDIEIEIPPARPDETYSPNIDATAREELEKLAAESRKLRDDANALQKSQRETAEAIERQLADAQAATQAELRAIAEQLRKPVGPTQPTPPDCDPITGQCRIDARPDHVPPKPATSSAPDISTEIPSGPTASKWLKVGKWIAGTAVAVAAPEFAIPLSIGMTVVGWLATRVRKRKGAGHRPGTFPGLTGIASPDVPAGPQRDNTEIQQILSLRQQEQRDPIHDALFGVLFEDEYRSKPDQSVKDAWLHAMDRFNNIAPLSTKSQTVTSTTKGA